MQNPPNFEMFALDLIPFADYRPKAITMTFHKTSANVIHNALKAIFNKLDLNQSKIPCLVALPTFLMAILRTCSSVYLWKSFSTEAITQQLSWS